MLKITGGGTLWLRIETFWRGRLCLQVAWTSLSKVFVNTWIICLQGTSSFCHCRELKVLVTGYCHHPVDKGSLSQGFHFRSLWKSPTKSQFDNSAQNINTIVAKITFHHHITQGHHLHVPNLDVLGSFFETTVRIFKRDWSTVWNFWNTTSHESHSFSFNANLCSCQICVHFIGDEESPFSLLLSFAMMPCSAVHLARTMF